VSAETKSRPAEEFIPTRKSLLSRIKNSSDDESWRTFFNTYWKLIYSAATKSGLNDAEAQDVVQETIIAVARNIGEFKYDPAVCSFKTWLLQVTRSRILNQLRSKKRRHEIQDTGEETPSRTSLIERVADPAGDSLERLWDEEWEKNLMDAAIGRVKRRADVEQFQIFDLYVLKNWPVKKVAKTLGISIGQVYLAKHRVSKMIKKEIAVLEAKGL
jgi:RNA polymerase sigma factor (sigma-70 family)